jgi:hypothetical protein
MASRKTAVTKKTSNKRNVTSRGKAKARKGAAPKVGRAKKPDPKRSAAGRKAAEARWGKRKRATEE